MATDIPIPSLPAIAADSPLLTDETLPARINTASRKQHTELNRLIVQRLALALPPYTRTPLLYGKGLATFAQVFFLFEEEWAILTQEVLGTTPTAELTSEEAHKAGVRGWLAGLRPATLPRSERIREDLRHLEEVVGKGIFETASLSQDAWTTEMRTRLRAQPHILVAYAWVMYMAVFSGGRYIRQELANAGVSFWVGHNTSDTLPVSNDMSKEEKGELPADVALDIPGFSFLSFDSDDDGAAIKTSFKSELQGAETVLSEQERQDIVQAATQIFDRCIFLIHDLDRIIARRKTRAFVDSIFAILAMILIFVFINM